MLETKDQFDKRLRELGLNMTKFSNLIGFSYSAVSKYGKENPVPKWVSPFLDLYEENQRLCFVKDEIQELAKKFSDSGKDDKKCK